MEYAYNANWVLCEAAQALFSNASSLVFTGDKGKAKELFLHNNIFFINPC